MKTHRAHAQSGLEFLFVEAKPPVQPGTEAVGTAFDLALKEQSERLLAKLGADGTSALEPSAALGSAPSAPLGPTPSAALGSAPGAQAIALQPEAAQPPLVPISERISIWLGPAAIEISQEGLRSFGRGQGLTEDALDALLGRNQPVAPSAVNPNAPILNALSSNAPAPAGAPLPVEVPLTVYPSAPTPAEAPVVAPLKLDLGGWDPTAQAWLAERWAGKGAPDLRLNQQGWTGSGFARVSSSAAPIRLDWASLSAEGIAPEAEAPLEVTAAVTGAFLAARAALEPSNLMATAAERPAQPAAHRQIEGAHAHSGGSVGSSLDAASGVPQDLGEQQDLSQQPGSSDPGQSGARPSPAAAMTGQQLSERFGELLGRRMIQQIEQGNWKLDIALHPDDLGSIQVEMVWRDGQLEAVLRAEQVATRELLDQGLWKLRESLLNSGTNLAYLAVNDDKRRQEQGRPDRRQDRRAVLAEDMEVKGVKQDSQEGSSHSRLDILV